MRTEVYSWRVSSELKTDLEREARLRKASVASVLELAAREWLNKSGANIAGDEEQRRLHEAALSCFGVISGGDPRRSQNARKVIRERLGRRYGR
jgi:hypothetical protein